ncbi:hypothetical protein BH24BAC1_BH24BAC1_32230 [soil metagenome]
MKVANRERLGYGQRLNETEKRLAPLPVKST